MKIAAALFALLLAGCSHQIANKVDETPIDSQHFDIVLAGGTVYDGSGGEPYSADVGIAGDTIVAVGNLNRAAAGRRLDVSGLAVVPGFVDIHSHAHRRNRKRNGIILYPDAENYIRQGVTTVIGGPDGSSAYPLTALFEQLEAAPASVNFASFIGHNTIRTEVMGRDNRSPSDAELAAMSAKVAESMEHGAFGLSTGLKYIPGAYSATEEVIELAKVVGRYGGIHISHMREEGLELLESVAETIRIGEEGGLPTQITHHKAIGASMWGRSRDSLALVDAARARGVDISIDQYPYAASSTGISVLFPSWSLAGDDQAFAERIAQPKVRAKIKAGIVQNIIHDRGGNDVSRVVIAQCDWNPSFNGKSFRDILQARNRPVSVQEAAELAIEIQASGGCQGIFHAMSEQDVERIMVHPLTMIASDGGIEVPGNGMPHPRNYGSFARVLGYYVRERQLLSLPLAIHKMSHLPADRLGLSDRGRIAPGAKADIAVFDPNTVIDRATFADPHQYAEGVLHVFVNGRAALLNGRMTGQRFGRVLRNPTPNPAQKGGS